jgi:hypothetical protein
MSRNPRRAVDANRNPIAPMSLVTCAASASGCAVGVILLGLPTPSRSRQNVAPEVARLKGEAEAVRKAMMGSVARWRLNPDPD